MGALSQKDTAGDRVNVCLETTEESVAAVVGWEAGAAKMVAKMAAKQAPAMFGKPLTEAQLQERFQFCLKTSAQGVKFVKFKATLANVRFWNSQGQLWVMNQRCGLLPELRDVQLDDGMEDCPNRVRVTCGLAADTPRAFLWMKDDDA